MSELGTHNGDPNVTNNLFRHRTAALDDIERAIASTSTNADSARSESRCPPRALARATSFQTSVSTGLQDDEPPLLVKVTGYRILYTTLVLTLGMWKSVATYRNEAILSSSLDLVLGVILAILLYWLGLYEAVEPPRMRWLFHEDYATALSHCCRRSRPIVVQNPSQPAARRQPYERRHSPPPSIHAPHQPPLSSPDAFQIYRSSPQWQRGSAPFYNYIDAVLLPHAPRDKAYTFRVQKGNIDLGIRATYEVEDDGSQKVNFLEYNEGYGIRDDTPIRVYMKDPETELEHLVAQWK